MKVVVWLEWPEACFRVTAADLRLLRKLLPVGAKLVRARSERAFLCALPSATHAIVWNFSPDWFARAPCLRVLATPAAGRELVPETPPPGVAVHFGGFHGPIIAETVVAFLLAWARGFLRPERLSGVWPRVALSSVCHSLSGTEALVVGYGRIGKAIAAALTPLGVSVTGLSRHALVEGEKTRRPTAEAIDAALRRADWLVLALPSTTGTDNWLDAARLRKLPRRAVVVNIGRGNAIDEKALAGALAANRLAGAYLDVRKYEPSGTVPVFAGFSSELARDPRVISMPHAAAFAPDYVQRCFRELAAEGLLTER